MSRLCCVGLSHRSAGLDVREQLAVPLAETAELLRAVCALPGVGEAVVISTCNRVELYVAAEPGAQLPDEDALLEPLVARAGVAVPLDEARR